MTEPLTLAQRGAAMTPMQDHIDRFWRMLETEYVRLLVDMRRDTTSVPYWDSSSFPDEVAKALVADRASLLDANKALTAERDHFQHKRDSLWADYVAERARREVAEATLTNVTADRDRLSAELAEAQAEKERLQEIVRRYGDKGRMAWAPPELQPIIEDAMAASSKEASQ